jgi:acyl-ACP thioesterase
MRLDAVARYLQDIAADDVRDAGLSDDVVWVVRRTAIEIRRWPRYEDIVELATWCSGVGAAWAERRTSLLDHGEAVVETASIWVSLDPDTMRPVPPGDRFGVVYGSASGGRRVRSTLSVPRPNRHRADPGRPWPLRSADLDVVGHVNNAVAWVAVEDELARVAPDAGIVAAEAEYHAGIDAATPLVLRSEVVAGAVLVWLSGADGGPPLVSARVRTAPPAVSARLRTTAPPRPPLPG